ncbi:MAG: tRNA (5-methylaminomethyl-2-thiouridine)(34)-methyltransferase MnmD [Thermoflexibacter sp.]
MHRKVIATKDGSSTIFWEELNETYHSIHGAWQESEHVFIREGLAWYTKHSPIQQRIAVFEVGLGTGLNAILTLKYCLQNPDIQVSYYSIEPYPLTWEEITRLNYKKLLSEDLQQHFDYIHDCKWEKTHQILPSFSFHKSQQNLQSFSNSPNLTFDIVYFDAFAPAKQPEMWELTSLSTAVALLKEYGILVTYCAKGSFKRDLKSLGMQVQSPHGAAGKREMTRGIKVVV